MGSVALSILLVFTLAFLDGCARYPDDHQQVTQRDLWHVDFKVTTPVGSLDWSNDATLSTDARTSPTLQSRPRE